jgi:tripartite-type tricarboxylate transporter receptor subunit TctC
VYLPAKTPVYIVVKLHNEIAKAIEAPAVKERFAALGIEPMPMTLAQFGKFYRDDVAANIALVKAAKIPTQ